MDSDQCQYCFNGDDAYGNPCLYCKGDGFEIIPNLAHAKPFADPIVLAERAIKKVFHCKCDVVAGDHPRCPMHKQIEPKYSCL